jgi:hypothetical protein
VLTVKTRRRATPHNEPINFPPQRVPSQLTTTTPQPLIQTMSNKEDRIQRALEDVRNQTFRLFRQSTAFHNVKLSTLTARRRGRVCLILLIILSKNYFLSKKKYSYVSFKPSKGKAFA